MCLWKKIFQTIRNWYLNNAFLTVSVNILKPEYIKRQLFAKFFILNTKPHNISYYLDTLCPRTNQFKLYLNKDFSFTLHIHLSLPRFTYICVYKYFFSYSQSHIMLWYMFYE